MTLPSSISGILKTPQTQFPQTPKPKQGLTPEQMRHIVEEKKKAEFLAKRKLANKSKVCLNLNCLHKRLDHYSVSDQSPSGLLGDSSCKICDCKKFEEFTLLH